jgi:hypothetical protein
MRAAIAKLNPTLAALAAASTNGGTGNGAEGRLGNVNNWMGAR